MSFFYPNSATSARTRRGKEREGHHRANSISTSSRRHKESSKSQDNKSPPSKSPVLSASLYAQQNFASEHLPPLPLPESATTAPASPKPKASHTIPNTGGVFQLTQLPYTPVALQQYLESDVEDEEDGEDPQEGSSLTSSLHLPSKADTEFKVGPTTRLNDPHAHAQESSSGYSASPDDRTPLAEEQNRKSPILSSSIRAATESTKAKDLRNAPNPTGNKFEQCEELNSLNKQITNLSDPGARAEYKDQDNDADCAKAETLLSSHRIEHKQRPNSQVSGLSKKNETQSMVQQRQPSLPRPASRVVSPLLARTFTPPAPPLGVLPRRSSPPYMSPVPVRATVPGDAYGYTPHLSYSATYQDRVVSNGYQGQVQVPYHIEYPVRVGHSYDHAASNIVKPSETPVSMTSSTDAQRFLGHKPSGPGSADDPLTLLAHLRATLPHMQTLLNRMQQGGHDPSIGQSYNHDYDSYHHQILADKNTHIGRLLQEAKDLKQQHLEEIAELKLEIKAVEAQNKDLLENSTFYGNSHNSISAELEDTRTQLKVATEALEEKESMIRGLKKEKELVKQEFEARTNNLALELQGKTQEALSLKEQILQLKDNNLQDKEACREKCDQRIETMTELLAKEKMNIEMNLARETERADTLHTIETSTRQVWQQEKASLLKDLEGERTAMQARIDEERATTQKQWQSRLETDLNEVREENSTLQKDLEILKSTWEKDRAKLFKTIGDFKYAATKVNQENVCTCVSH